MVGRLMPWGGAVLALFAILLCLSFASTASATSQTRYPVLIERGFLNACIANSFGEVAYCKCALRRLEATVTLRAFIVYDRALRGLGTAAPNLRTAAKIRAAMMWCL
jgi:hypothetical protein